MDLNDAPFEIQIFARGKVLGWQFGYASFTVPANVTEISVRFAHDSTFSAGEVAYIDNVSLTPYLDFSPPTRLTLSTGDSDGDGLSDFEEVSFGTNPLMADSDSDGFNDKVEIVNHSDPLNKFDVPTLLDDSSPPLITQNPQDQTVEVGHSIVLAVATKGSDTLTYQWFKNGNTLPGASFSSYTISDFRTTDIGLYSVLVSNSQGSAISDKALVSMTSPLAQEIAFGLSRLAFGPTQGFRLQFKPIDGKAFKIESSIDLKTWVQLLSFPSNSGPVEFIDSAANQFPRRYYRAIYF